MKRPILTTILALITFTVFAKAGIAERWEENWIRSYHIALTILAIQLIIILGCLIAGRKRKPLSSLMACCEKIAGNRYSLILVGGLLLCVNIGVHLDCVLNTFSIVDAFLAALIIFIIDFIAAFTISKWQRYIRPSALYYMFIMLVGVPVAMVIYNYAIQVPWINQLYSCQMRIDSVFNDTVTVTPVALSSDFIIGVLEGSAVLYFPWLLSVTIKALKSYFRRH